MEPWQFGLIGAALWVVIAICFGLLIGGAIRERDAHAPQHGRRAKR